MEDASYHMLSCAYTHGLSLVWFHVLKDNRFSGEMTSSLRMDPDSFKQKKSHHLLCIHICTQIWCCHGKQVNWSFSLSLSLLGPIRIITFRFTHMTFLPEMRSIAGQLIKPIKLVHRGRVAARSRNTPLMYIFLTCMLSCYQWILSRNGSFKR